MIAILKTRLRERLSKLPTHSVANGKRAPSAEQVATTLYEVLVKLAVEGGQSASEVFIRKPGEARHFDDTSCWVVAWESGPHNWPHAAWPIIADVTNRLAEPYYSFDLCLYDNE